MRRTRHDGRAKAAEDAKRMSECRAIGCRMLPRVAGCDFCDRHWKMIPAELRALICSAVGFDETSTARSSAIRHIARTEGPIG